jgi:hypothetical protein
MVMRYLIFDDILFFKKPKNIKLILNNLNFIKNKKHYGANLVGGVTKLNLKDFKTIKI